MPQDTHIHIHIHEGASPEAVRAGVEAAHAAESTAPPSGASAKAAESSETSTPDQFLKVVERAYKDSYAKAKPLLEFLADNPDRMIPYPEVSKALGFTNNRSLPGLLGAFGRRASHRYGGVKPFEAHWNGGAWYLYMSPEAAELINKLR